MGRVVDKIQCPACASKGKDNRGDNLSVYEDGSTYCHACGHYTNNKRKEAKEMSEPADISKYASYKIKELVHKPISLKIAERFGVRTVTNVETGKPSGVLYPYYDGSEVIGYKVRNLPKEFYFKGDASKVGLFGQQLYKKGGKGLIVVEGEDDALAVAELLDVLGKDLPVVSIPNGADQNGVIDAKVKKQFDFISSFKTVLLALDNDEPGKVTAKSLADWLAPNTEVKIARFPDGVKDASDLLKDDNGSDVLWQCLREAEKYSPEGVVEGGAIPLQELLKQRPRGFETPYPELDDKLKGLRKGELTLFTAGSGIGKSTITREIGYHFIKNHGLKVANIMLEEPIEKSMLGYIALDNNIPLGSLYMNPQAYEETRGADLKRSYDTLVDNGCNFFFRHFGSLENDTLMTKMRYYANALDVDFIILDHISMVISGQDGGNERKSIDLLMTDLAAFCNETGVGVLAVVHLKRKNTGGGKEKALNEGGQVSLTDLRGSGGLEQMSWNVVALERNQQSTEEANFSTVRVLKNRMFGFTGQAGRLYYDAESGRLLPAPDPEHYQEE